MKIGVESSIHLALVAQVALLPLTWAATGFRTVGSSGCAAQMVFIPPNTTTVVFIDNYHENHGGPGFNPQTNTLGPSWLYPEGSTVSVFGTQYNLSDNTIRALRPQSDTFCSAGAFFDDGTLLNVAGAEPGPDTVAEGFDKLRTFSPGPCTEGACIQDWVEETTLLQHKRWYPSAQTLVDGSVLVVGGSDAGGLVLNEASINVPTYEIIFQDGRTPPAEFTLPILQFTDAQNLEPDYSYNLYPMLHLMPNTANTNQIFTVAGSQAVVWDYTQNAGIKTLPDTPLQPRTFPSSATSVLLPLVAPDYAPTVLMCGGSSGDMPNPVALNDCYIINPLDPTPAWTPTDNLPNGAQTMSDGILLPDGTVLILNGARIGCGGGQMADDPVLAPVIYNPTAAPGSRFTTQPATTIPRLYHSVAILLPSGEVLVSGSNPAVGYSATGTVGSNWPNFDNNGHHCALQQQQKQSSAYPTEYRVEIFSPPYMNAAARPIITSFPPTIGYSATFTVAATLSGKILSGPVEIVLSHPGFHTHGQAMGQRMVSMVNVAVPNSNGFTVTSPLNASVMPPGIYLIFVVVGGIPSEGVWVELVTG